MAIEDYFPWSERESRSPVRIGWRDLHDPSKNYMMITDSKGIEVVDTARIFSPEEFNKEAERLKEALEGRWYKVLIDRL